MKQPFARLLTGAVIALAMTGAAWAKVDVNHATEAQLQALHGVGPTKAHAMVVERRAHGPYKSIADISTRVPGIGQSTVTGFASDVAFAPASAGATSTMATKATPATSSAVSTHVMPPAAAAVHPATPAVATKTGASTTASTHVATATHVTTPAPATQKKK